jgi:glutamyl-tRNA synthetase
MSVVTRFAPSPTGFLHIGGARTALFNWLFARHHGGVFRLRIEDTDRERSTEAAVKAIFDGLNWLGLTWDLEPVFQSTRAARHAEVAFNLLAQGQAYYCYCSAAALEEMRARAKAEGQPWRYEGRCRNLNPRDAPQDVKPVVRFKAPQTGTTLVRDQVQGDIAFANEQLDDLIILRADGTPTYNLSVVVDDHDMDVTQVIRGQDHLTNTARQLQIYAAAGFPPPAFAHIPLIHGPDGAKLSKRHGALGVEAYRDMGYLPAALRNYLLRLGWSHGDDEIISTEQAVAWFDLEHIGRAPARFDFAKLENLNGHYIRQSADDELLRAALPFFAALSRRPLPDRDKAKLLQAMASLKARTKTLVEIAEQGLFLIAARPLKPQPEAQKHLDAASRALLCKARDRLALVQNWNAAETEAAVRALAGAEGIKLAAIAQPLRAALTGRTISPPVFEVLALLGAEESLARIDDALSSRLNETQSAGV